MKLNEKDRIETIAKEAALRHYLRTHPEATEEEAWRFAVRSWRLNEFVHVACDCLAWWMALAEEAA